MLIMKMAGKNPRLITLTAKVPILLIAINLLAIPASASDDSRLAVEMPDMMKTHMLSNMRDHLLAINEIQAALAQGKFDLAADAAENRLGLSSLEAHEASHMASFMPKGMEETGNNMHRAASRFAIIAQETAVDRNLPRALDALSQITQQCVACHAGYRLK
jgi:hypothetical protein